MNDLFLMQKDLREMPEWIRLANIRQFSVSLTIFQKNADELIGRLEAVRHGPAAVAMWSLDKRPALYQFQIEVARLLHNFVASSFSLVDHARRFHSKNYKDAGEFGDYDAEVKTRFAEVPLCQFVQGLRNYFVHKQMPSIHGTLEFKSGEPLVHLIQLDKTELADFDWSAGAKAYLKDSPDKLDLLAVTQEYLQRVRSFYDWVFQRLNQIHAKDIEAIEKKQAQVSAEFGKMVPGHLESDLRILQQIRTKPENLFLSYMDPGSWKRICDAHPDPADRAAALLDHVAQYASLMPELRQRVTDAFKAYYKTE